jgi:formate dehydrogenase subunit delta
MNVEHLVRMANDIGAFFAAEPSREAAALAVLNHIKRFWDPRMRRQMVEHFRAGGEGLDEPARSAIELLASETAKDLHGARGAHGDGK